MTASRGRARTMVRGSGGANSNTRNCRPVGYAQGIVGMRKEAEFGESLCAALDAAPAPLTAVDTARRLA